MGQGPIVPLRSMPYMTKNIFDLCSTSKGFTSSQKCQGLGPNP